MKLVDITPRCKCRADFLRAGYRVRRDGRWIVGRNHSRVGKSAHWYRKALYLIDYKREKIYRLVWR